MKIIKKFILNPKEAHKRRIRLINIIAIFLDQSLTNNKERIISVDSLKNDEGLVYKSKDEFEKIIKPTINYFINYVNIQRKFEKEI